jgi:hypothetical protein
MKAIILIILFFALLFGLMGYCESKKYPYEEGMHTNYRIICENGFVYKYQHGATMQIFNSDGTPLKCGKKIY